MYVIEISEPEFEKVIVRENGQVRETHEKDKTNSCHSSRRVKNSNIQNVTTDSFDQPENIDDQGRVADENDQIIEAKLTQWLRENKFRLEGECVKCGRRQKMANYFTEFMNNSSIHGFKYLVGSERSLIEKCFWLAILSASTYLCATQVAVIYKKWEENPTFIGLSQDPVQLWELPFPAVTVCPGYRINNNATYYNNSHLWNNSQKDYMGFILKTSFSREHIFRSCVIYGRPYGYDGCEWFSPILTERGLCFSSNMLDRRELFNNVTYVPDGHAEHYTISGWNFDGRNRKINKTESYPLTAINSYSFDLNSLEGIGSQGFGNYAILLHHPTEIPTLTSTTVFLKEHTDTSTTITIKSKVTVSAEGLKSYSPQRRKCFFTFERQLHFYKTYSFENCKMECLANYTLKLCGCVSYFMPRNATTTVCPMIIACTYDATEFVTMSEQEISDDPYFKSCNCLPSCTSVVYISNVNIDDIMKPNVPQVYIVIEPQDILSLERNELFGDITFLASCGGLLGLFTGFSFMSLIEIVYYLCFRWVHNVAKSYWQK